MSFTDRCDLFASFHEDGFNRIIEHVRSQRPSLFNYATAGIAKNRKLLCHAIAPHKIIYSRNNPLLTIVDPLPIPGTNYGVNFAVQLAELRLDFHPGDEFNLPPELTPPLGTQRLAIKLRICGGIGCPPDNAVDQFVAPPSEMVEPRSSKHGEERDHRSENQSVIPLPTRQLICFCLDAYATGGLRIVDHNGTPYLEFFIEGFEIVDIKPTELENNIECYIGLMLKLVVLPGLRVLLRHAPLNLTQGTTDLFPQPTNVVLSPMPISGGLAHNPAIEEDLLKVFIKVEVN